MEEEIVLMHPEIKSSIEKIIESMGIVEYETVIEPGCKKGDNYLGVVAKVTVTGKKNGKSQNFHWIAKYASRDKSFREFAVIDQIFPREAYLYQNLFPIFYTFQKERQVPKPFTNYPHLIWAHLKQFNELIVMEDMRYKGFSLKDRKEPLDLEHVKAVMKIYGKLHAISYAIKDQDPDLFNIIKENTKETFITFLTKEVFVLQEKVFCAKSLSALDPVKHDYHGKVFEKYMARSFEYVLELVKKSQEDPYAVVSHGDGWINNILFKYEDKTQPDIPTEVCLIDFQLSRCGSPAIDLAYFIFTCTEKALRDEHFNTLISTYYESLSDHLKNLGSCPKKMLPIEELQQQFKKYSVVGYFCGQIVLHLMISDSEETPCFNQGMTCDEFLGSFVCKSENEGIYMERIQGILVDFVEKGYFDFLFEE